MKSLKKDTAKRLNSRWRGFRLMKRVSDKLTDYDLKCRNCGREPSCDYVSRHKQAIMQQLEQWRKKGEEMKTRRML